MALANNCWVLPLRILFQFVLIKLDIIMFGYAHLHSRKIVERFEPNTVLWTFHTIQPSIVLSFVYTFKFHMNETGARATGLKEADEISISLCLCPVVFSVLHVKISCFPLFDFYPASA